MLKARCVGSAPQPYAVEITLGNAGTSMGHCSCPVGGGGRGSHAEAAGYLQRVRKLLSKLGEEDEWQALIAAVRERHRRLPALLDELRKAGL